MGQRAGLMRPNVFLALIVLLASTAATAGQDADANPVPTTLPVAVSPPPTVSPTYPAPFKVQCLDDVRLDMNDGYGSYWYCLYFDSDQRLSVGLVDDQDMMFDGAKITINTALYLLANPNAVALHPVLLNAAGDGLEKLRAAELAEVRRRDYRSEYTESSLVALNRGAIGRLIDKTRALKSLGYQAEAIASVAKVLTAFEKKLKPGKKLSEDKQWQWMSLRSSYNGMMVSSGAIKQGLAGYKALATDTRIIPDYRTNAKVNLAALLAENGQYEEALSWIDEALAEFTAQQEDWENYKLSGSDRHFAWIRACALVGLGREKEAKPLIDLVLASPENPVDIYADVYSTSSIERRLYSCTGDVERMVAFVKKGYNHPLFGHFAYLYLQPELNFQLPHHDAFLKKVRAHPDLKALAAEMVPVPASVVPALNNWR
jgi:tetratricopeptide (TPR) repeat protein